MQKKRHRRGKRGGRKQREKAQARQQQGEQVAPARLDPQQVMALRGRLALLTRMSA